MEKRRSNIREVKEKVQSHILECFEFEESFDSVGDELHKVIQGFNKWWQDHNHIKNHQEAFSRYLMCLPTEFTVEFQTYDMGQRLESWLGYDDRQYSEDEIINRYLWLIYREFTVLCRKHKVQFV